MKTSFESPSSSGAMSASAAATVHEGHISNNAISLGNSGGQAPNAIHLDASGGGAGTSPQVAGIHIIGNTIEGYPVPETASPGAGIHIANGASDMTIVANRTNFQANAIEIVGEVGVTDGITIVAFGANSPANGYNTGVGSENENGIVLQPGTLDSPAAATASPVAGGELAPGNYLVSVSYVTAGGQETLSSIDTLVTLASGNGTIAVESPTAPDVAVFYNVYVSAVNGDHATETRQNASPILIGMMFTLTALETGGASPPSASTAVMTIQNVTLTGCNLTGCSLHGLLVDGSLGGVITGVSAIANNLWGYSTPSDAVDVLPGAITNVNISSNPGYNPVGNVTPPTIAIGTFANPYQQPVRIAIVSPGSTITSVSITSASGGSMTTGLKPGPDGVMLQLGVGESIALSGSSIGSSSWKWFRS